MVTYNFYCLICGEQFSAGKSNAQTCGTGCRVALSKVKRQLIEMEDISPEELEEADEKVAAVKGEDGLLRKISKGESSAEDSGEEENED